MTPGSTSTRLDAALTDRVRLVAVTGMSNVTGTIPPLERIVELVHARGARVLVDAAQSLPHHRLNFGRLGVDFVAFSGHKICGPTGIGVLYAKRELLEAMPPVSFGGNMVVRVDRERSEWNEIPWKFEAGTPPIAEAIGLGAAIDYLSQFSAQETRRPRTGAADACPRRPGPDRVPADPRPGRSGTERGDRELHDRGNSSARPGTASRPPRHRDPRGTSLRHAPACASRNTGLRARQLLPVQYK